MKRPNPNTISPKEAADLLGITVTTFYHFARCGQFSNFVKYEEMPSGGPKYIISRGALEFWLKYGNPPPEAWAAIVDRDCEVRQRDAI